MAQFEAGVRTAEHDEAQMGLQIVATNIEKEVRLLINGENLHIHVHMTPALLRGLAVQLRSVADTAERSQDAAAVWRRDA